MLVNPVHWDQKNCSFATSNWVAARSIVFTVVGNRVMLAITTQLDDGVRCVSWAILNYAG
jgi:hypothetical protein